MNQRLFHSLTAAVFASAVGATLPSHAQQVDQLEDLFQRSGDASDVSPATSEELSATPTSTSIEPTDGEVATEPQPETASEPAIAIRNQPRRSTLVNVISHPLDDYQAATLYVQNIPVLTFLGPELTTLSDNKASDGADANLDPAVQAQAIADDIADFHGDAGDASTIAVRWDGDQSAYVIALNGEDLLTFGDEVMLPDTTNDPAQDALQATNRLRRLLGGAEPLVAIAGQPEPSPRQAAPGPTGGRVVSTTTGRASWYGPGFHGRRTANGEVFNQNALTAAHRTLPFGTVVRVTNLSNNSQVTVRINDRGPFTGGRIIDLSAEAARVIGLHRAGVGTVRVEVLETP